MKTIVAGGVHTFVTSFETAVMDALAEAGPDGLNKDKMSERDLEVARQLVFRGLVDESDDGASYKVRNFERQPDIISEALSEALQHDDIKPQPQK